jgi:hypothetical protein
MQGSKRGKTDVIWHMPLCLKLNYKGITGISKQQNDKGICKQSRLGNIHGCFGAALEDQVSIFAFTDRLMRKPTQDQVNWMS